MHPGQRSVSLRGFAISPNLACSDDSPREQALKKGTNYLMRHLALGASREPDSRQDSTGLTADKTLFRNVPLTWTNGAPLRNRTVDLLLTIGTICRTSPSSCTDTPRRPPAVPRLHR